MGFLTGEFTSPHVSSFRERIKISGELAEKEDIVAASERLFGIMD